jgi:hypothetical protein
MTANRGRRVSDFSGIRLMGGATIQNDAGKIKKKHRDKYFSLE